jgi:hypothetical protein
MMTDENTPDSKLINTENSPDLADKKGQMLVIYLPEGSVIVDRTDVNLSTAPQAIIEQIVPKAEEIHSVVDEPVLQQLQPTLQEVVQLAVAEVLRITGAAIKNPLLDVSSAPEFAPRVHVRSKRKRNWVHGINTFFVTYVLLVSIIPTLVSSAFGVVVYASKLAHPGVSISKGDLMVAQLLPASQLKEFDVLLVRSGNSWRLDTRKITAVNTIGALSTITTVSTDGLAIDRTYVLPKESQARKLSRVIPKLGYAPIILSSTIAKAIAGLFLLILNLMVTMRRSRKRRLETVIR